MVRNDFMDLFANPFTLDLTKHRTACWAVFSDDNGCKQTKTKNKQTKKQFEELIKGKMN